MQVLVICVYLRLQHEVSLLEATSEDMSFGLYKPQYSFDTSHADKAALDAVYEQKKSCIRDDGAAVYPTSWTVNNSAAEGRRMISKSRSCLEHSTANAMLRLQELTGIM